jgi:hypothetical protein
MTDSPQGKESPVRYTLSSERWGRTLRFKLVAAREAYVLRHTIEDEIYEAEVGPEYRNIVGYCTVSTYKDGTPGEVLLTIGKEGHELHGWADKWSKLLSLLLQYGVDPRTVYDSMKFQAFEPSGFTSCPKVPMCKSIVDLVIRWMEATFPPTAKEVDGDAYSSLLDSVVEQ